MDYILHKIELKLKTFRNKNEKLSMINLYRSKFIYIITLYLAIYYNQNQAKFSASKVEILKALRSPSEGTLLRIINLLQDEEISHENKADKRDIFCILQEYVNIRNKDFGHDYSCDPYDHEDLIKKLEKLSDEINHHSYPFISKDFYHILVNGKTHDGYEGTCYTPNGGMDSWEITTSSVLNPNEIYITAEPQNVNKFKRISPFIYIDDINDDIYIFRQLYNEVSGVVHYIKFFRKNPGIFQRNWPELSLPESAKPTNKTSETVIKTSIDAIDNISKKEKEDLVQKINELKTHKCDVLVIGDNACGKTSAINTLFNTNIAKINVLQSSNITKYEIGNITIREASLSQAYHIDESLRETPADVILFVIDACRNGLDFNKSLDYIKDNIIPITGNSDNIVFGISRMDYFPQLGSNSYRMIVGDFNTKILPKYRDRFGKDAEAVFFYSASDFQLDPQNTENIVKLLRTIIEKAPVEKRFAFDGATNQNLPQTTSEQKSSESTNGKPKTGNSGDMVKAAASAFALGATAEIVPSMSTPLVLGSTLLGLLSAKKK